MYPGPTGAPENHKKGYCSDGVQQKARAGESLPPWPQPLGVFVTGSHFSPLKFLLAIRDLYEKVSGGHAVESSQTGSTMEDEAFAQLLIQRTNVVESVGTVLFELYDLPFAEDITDNLIVDEGGKKYLRIDCLKSP
jgi:hypothetical protein